MGIGEVEVRQGIGLGILQQPGRLGTEPLYLRAGEMVELPYQRRVLLVEHGMQDGQDRGPLLPCRGTRSRVAHEMHDAALPGGAGEDLLDGQAQALVGVGGHADHVMDAPFPQGAQERHPACMGLGVDGIQSQKPAVAVGSRADGRDQRA